LEDARRLLESNGADHRRRAHAEAGVQGVAAELAEAFLR
jgi:hypothetical protein